MFVLAKKFPKAIFTEYALVLENACCYNLVIVGVNVIYWLLCASASSRSGKKNIPEQASLKMIIIALLHYLCVRHSDRFTV